MIVFFRESSTSNMFMCTIYFFQTMALLGATKQLNVLDLVNFGVDTFDASKCVVPENYLQRFYWKVFAIPGDCTSTTSKLHCLSRSNTRWNGVVRRMFCGVGFHQS